MTSAAVATVSDTSVAAAIAAAMGPAGADGGAATAAPSRPRPVVFSRPVVDETIETPFTWAGSPWSLVGPCLFNAFMSIITVGIYSFWGRTELRRRMWACVRLDGEPLAYHGTGLEMFKGFTAAVLVILLPIFVLSTVLVIAYGQGSASWNIFQFALFVLVYPVLKGFASYRARRYRLSRTSWRGIRGSVSGSAAEFAFLGWATSLLTPLTLGWIEPWRSLYVQRFMTGDTMLGDRKLRMQASAKSLYVRYALLWVGTLAILITTLMVIGAVVGPEAAAIKTPAGWSRFMRTNWLSLTAAVATAIIVWSLISSYYYANLYSIAASTTVMLPPQSAPDAPPLRFKLTINGPALMVLFLSNLFISYGTLFILRPVANARSLRYFTKHLSVLGAFDPATINQNPNAAHAEGEGLAQAFDFDAF